MDTTGANIKISNIENAGEPVPCSEQLAYLSYKAGQLRERLTDSGQPRHEYKLGNDTVELHFNDDGSTRLVRQAVEGRNDQVTYMIVPGQRFAYEVHDAEGTLADSWSRPADAMLTPDEAASLAYPLYMILQALSQQRADAA